MSAEEMNREEDGRIIERVLKGERNHYAHLIDRYKGPIFNLTYRMTGSREDANDLAQEAFVRAYENLKRFDRSKPFSTWLYTIGLNIVRNHIKREKRILKETHNALGDGEVEKENPLDPEQVLSAQQKTRKLEKYLKTLPEEQKEAIMLKYYQGLMFEDVAEIMGISLSAAKMRVYRGLEKLRTMM